MRNLLPDREFSFSSFVAGFLFWVSVLQLHGEEAAPPVQDSASQGPGFFEQLAGNVPTSISGNPSAIYDIPGSGLLGEWIGLPRQQGVWLGGVWIGNTNALISGGAEPGRWSWNSMFLLGFNIDAEKFMGWQGASFGIQFLQFDGEDTNGQAGSVQGYNSLPGPPPLDRSQLYQLWYRQSFFDDRLSFRIGKMVPTYEFNNVVRPVSTRERKLSIPSVTGLLFTPIFVNPSMLGAIGGYYNSVSGLTVSAAPTRNSYVRYGFFDGNVARGVQTGMMGPQFNGFYFHILEAGLDWVLNENYPGVFGAGLWHQTGTLMGPNNVQQSGTGGFYLFGSQRVWMGESKSGETVSTKGDAVPKNISSEVASCASAPPAVSIFYQYGANDSRTLPVNQFLGLGATAFHMISRRPDDSFGVGMAWSWLNPEIFARSSELMFQGYYQGQIVDGIFLSPAVSYIPTPGASPELGGAWAVTLQATVLF